MTRNRSEMEATETRQSTDLLEVIDSFLEREGGANSAGEGGAGDVDLVDEEEDAGTFRARCNTWPRQQLEASQESSQHHLQHQRLQHHQKPHVSFGGRIPLLQRAAETAGDDSYSPPSSGPLPLVDEEESSAMDSSTTTNKPSLEENAVTTIDDEKIRTQAAPYSPTVPRASGASKSSCSRRNPWGNLSYADLITQAIQSSPERRLTLAQIYDWLVKNIPYFSGKGDSVSSIGWKVSG